jgi:hypothetical protein
MNADNVTPIRGANKEQPRPEAPPPRRNKRRPERFLKLAEIDAGPSALDLVYGVSILLLQCGRNCVARSCDAFH